MDNSALAFLADCMTDGEINGRFGGISVNGIKQARQQAEERYNKWIETITDREASDRAFNVVIGLMEATEKSAFLNGLTAGIGLTHEALSVK